MRVIQRRDLKTKAITSFDVFVQVLFNGDAPQKFDPNKSYSTGDLVWVTDDNGDNFRIMQATTSGFFVDAVEPNWTEYSLSKVLEEQSTTIENLTGIRSKISDIIYNTHVLYFTANTGTTHIDSIGSYDWENEYCYCELYVGGKFVPVNKWEITGDTLTMDSDVITKDDQSVVIRVNEANSLLTRMIKRLEVCVDATYSDKIVPINKNMLKPNPNVSVGNSGFTTVKCGNNGTYTINGTSATGGTSEPKIYIRGSENAVNNIDLPFDLPYGGFLTFSGNVASAKYYFRVINVDGQYFDVENQIAFTTGMKIAGLYVQFPEGTTYTNQNFKLQLEIGKEATDWVEYAEKRVTEYDSFPIPYPINPEYTAMQFDLYINGDFVPLDEITLGTDIDGNICVTDWPKTADVIDYTFMFEFVYSISNEVLLLKQDYTVTVSDTQQCYLLDLNPVDFINSFQEIKIFRNGNVVDPGRYVPGKGRINIIHPNYYFNIGDEISCSVWTYVLPSYVGGTVRHNSQSVPIVIEDTLTVTIPYLDWDVQRDDLLVFNDAGILLSNTKWYLDGYDMKYFKHDIGVTTGDILDFRMIDQEDSVAMQNIYIRVTSDNQKVFETQYDLSIFAFVMLFTSDGEYVTDSKYSIDKKRLIVSGGVLTLSTGDMLEIVGFKFVGSNTSTTFNRKIINGSNNTDQVYTNPYTDYNASTDSLLIFNNAGQYIGERFYSINGNKITLLGTGIDLGEYLEVILIRNLDITITTESFTEIIDKTALNLHDCYTDEVAVALKSLDLVKYGILTENDANYMRVQAVTMETTAARGDTKYEAAVLFSGTRCLLSINTVDATNPEYGVKPGDVIAVSIKVSSSYDNRIYNFNVTIDPKTLNVTVFGDTSTGESVIIPSLQRLLRAFPIKNVTGMTTDIITKIKGAEKLKLTATKDNVAISPMLVDTVDGELAINYGDITTSGVIKTEIIIYTDTIDYQYKFNITVTRPWKLIYDKVEGHAIHLTGLEDNYLEIEMVNGKTTQNTTKGENVFDVQRYVDGPGNTGSAAISNVSRETGTVSITSDGKSQYCGKRLTFLGIVDETATYVMAFDSAVRTNNNVSTVASVTVSYGDKKARSFQLFQANAGDGLDINGKSIEIPLGNFLDITNIDLSITVDFTSTPTEKSNTLTLNGLRFFKQGTLDKFEPFTGREPSPNPVYKQSIRNAGTKTYNILDLETYYGDNKTVVHNGVTFIYDDVNRDVTITGQSKLLLDGESKVCWKIMKNMVPVLKNGHVYKVSVEPYDETLPVDVEFRVTNSNGNKTYSKQISFDSSTISSVDVKLSVTSENYDFGSTPIPLHVMVVDLTENPKAFEYKSYGYEVEYVVANRNFFKWQKIPTGNKNGLVLDSNGDGSFTITGDVEDISEGSYWDYKLDGDDVRRIFTAGTYIMTTQDTESGLNPFAFVNIKYGGNWHNSVLFSRNYRKFTITDDMINEEGFALRIGIGAGPSATTPITNRTIYPMILRSDGDGSEWVANENGVYVADEFVAREEGHIPIWVKEPIRARDVKVNGVPTKLTNVFDPAWLDSKTQNGIVLTKTEYGLYTVSGTPTGDFLISKTFNHEEMVNTFKPGWYMAQSLDNRTLDSSDSILYPYFAFTKQVNNVNISETTSINLEAMQLTEDDMLNQATTVKVSMWYNHSKHTFSAKVMRPMIFYSTTGEEWPIESNGKRRVLPFIPHYSFDTNGYCGDMITELNGKYVVVRSINSIVLDRSMEKKFTKNPIIDTTPQEYRIGCSGIDYIAPGTFQDRSDVICDSYPTMPEICTWTNRVKCISSGRSAINMLYIYDKDYAFTSTMDDFLTWLDDNPIEVQYPVMKPTIEVLPEMTQRILKRISEMAGYKPEMYIYCTDSLNPDAIFQYKRRVDGE